MDEEITQIKTKYDEALENMPREVQDFMWSDFYDAIIIAIQKTVGLTDEQTKCVKNAGYDILMGMKTMEEVSVELVNSGITAESTAKILYLIDTEIITRAENITEFFTENTGEEESRAINSAPSPSDMLARLNQTLMKPTTLAPIKRDYSIEPLNRAKTDSNPSAISPNSTSSPQVDSAKTIDPYRETPLS